MTTTEIDGLPVHHVDHGGLAAGPTFVLVHGLGGSHVNWSLLAPLLTPYGRVLAVDLPGFGLTEARGRSASVGANTVVLDRWLREAVGHPVVLVGNSMGGLIASRQAARSPDTVGALVLIDPALPRAGFSLPDPVVVANFVLYMVPVVGPRYLARRRAAGSARSQVLDTLRLCSPHPDRIPTSFVDASVELIEAQRSFAGVGEAHLEAAKSIVRANARPARVWERLAGITAPVLLIQGDRDRLVPVADARAAAARNPSWTYVELAGVGHIPQIEVPADVAAHVAAWLPTAVEPAARA